MTPKIMIGLEVHVQLATKSKLFCHCPTIAEQPNTSCCPICLGHPGSKPVLNKKALDYAIKIALAAKSKINNEFFFSRKTYFYPDMAKDFQITQYELPVAEQGFVEIASGKKVRLRRIHVEEDPAALVHESGISSSAYSLVDYNRSGIPLAEIVTEPDMESPEEARQFLDSLLTMLNYLDVYAQGAGVLKADANISISGGERVEVKNITGFRAVEKALQYEAIRQEKLVKEGKKIARETRGFDDATSSTYPLRSKETEDDYGYITEPDLTKISLDGKWLEGIRQTMPELASEKAGKFIKKFKLKEYDAKVLASSRELGQLFEEIVAEVNAETASKFLTRELLGILNYNNLALKGSHINSKDLINLLKLIEQGKVSEKNAKLATIAYCVEKKPPKKYLEQNNLLIESGGLDIEAEVKKVLKENSKAVADLRAGNQKSMNFLVGLVMREVKGKADARKIKESIEQLVKTN